jgi:predicted AlkP superfamily phosphohydrolase/phosphomutase
VLAAVDEYAGDVLDLADDAHVFVVSDHGMHDYSWTFYVNSWLADNGYCETTTGETQYFPQMKSKLKAGAGGAESGAGERSGGNKRSGGSKRGGENERSGSEADVKSNWNVRAVAAAADALSTVGLSPRRVHRGLATVGLDVAVESLLPTEALLEAQNRTVDHPNSTAYQLLFNSFGVHLNVEGRDPGGRVPPDRYEAVRDRLMAELEAVRDPDGEPVFEDVQPREAVYEGPNIERAPDVVLTPRDYQYDVSGTLVDTFRRNRHKNHEPEGLLVSNRKLECDGGVSIYDVAPTVAAVLGLPPDSKTDGSVLPPFATQSDDEDWNDLGPSETASRRSAGEGEVESHLADLGYLE